MSIPTMDNSYLSDRKEHPDGWRWAKLGEVCEVIGGSTPDTGNSAYWNGDIAWVTPTDLGKFSDVIIFSTSRQITASGLQNCGTQMLPIGTVIMSSRAPIGHLAIAGVPLCTNQGCKSFVPKKDVYSEFLYWALKRSVTDIQALGSGATFAEVSKSILQQFEITLPAIPEQLRIAAILKEQMVAVEKARTAAQERLRAIKALPAAFLRKIFPDPGQPLPEGWRWAKLGQVVRLINGRAYHASELLTEGKYPVLRVGNLFTSNHWYYSDFELEPDKYCDKGDLIFAWSASFGPFIWTGPKVIYHYHIWKVDCGQSLDNEYARHALDMITAKIKSESHGMAMLHMTKEGMEQFEIPIPPLTEQHRIAATIKDQFAAVEQASVAAEAELKAINTLPAALLSRAFNGEL